MINVLFGTDKDIAGLTEHKGCVLIKQRIGRIKREDEIQNKHISDAKTTWKGVCV